jgi:hypothetical protein
LPKDAKNGLNVNKSKPFQPKHQVNSHHVSDTVSIDDIIDYSVNTHEIGMNNDDDDAKASDSTDTLLAHMAGRSSSLGDIRHVLAAKQKSDKGKKRKVNASKSEPGTLKLGDTTYFVNKGETITFNGQQYSAHVTMLHYSVGQHDVASMEQALVDCGANGGICGDDMRVLEGSERIVDVSGLAGHKFSQLRSFTAQALVTTHKGDAIATFHQMALLGNGKSILSCIQMEAFGADINDQSRAVSGGMHVIFMDGYQLPLEFKNGLPYLHCQKPTDIELS